MELIKQQAKGWENKAEETKRKLFKIINAKLSYEESMAVTCLIQDLTYEREMNAYCCGYDTGWEDCKRRDG